ncbi:PREDICTED: transcription factor FER-LIKE IRON DEFICIENCY-INDUCED TRANSCRIPTION FACTOR isoform X1 [Populus euphratica]|uniref:Transcription factor FER-LIKE IRON DEFICIENCY-INDUCED TRANSCRIPTION FACTOR isoform X1 n=1 Tax=Populus euphratica TaxID=75702 RepID=A0AAJ6TQG8_POPEU|nr:PREDICTED: transcription factor FER-LIKE IRON DEFICIENCY-INDUCED TRANSCRIPTION FACTOR isoform X1 [Populus euphratica]
MDRMDDPTGDPLAVQTNYQFQLHDFIDEANFDRYIDLIRGENEITAFDCDLINGFLVDSQFGLSTGDTFDCDLINHVPAHTSSAMEQDPNYVPIALPSFDGDMGLGAEEDTDEEDSSGTTTTTKKTKKDRSRTLISERRRRGRMKEKLYALRSLVPNITKMDKASIIGDAVLYVQELQMQANKLKADIASLESSLIGSDRYQGSNRNPKNPQNTSNNHPIRKKIIKMDVFQVEERGFYVRLVCSNGEGVAASLYRALESLTSFSVQNSNLATTSEGFVLTFTLNVKESEHDMNLPNLKLWVTGALLNQGFELLTA